MRRSKIFILLFALTIPRIVSAEPEGIHKYKLAELIEQAMRQSHWLASSQARTEEKRFAAKQAGAWQNPSVSFSVGSKEAGGARGSLYEATMTQPLAFPGKRRLRREIGELDAQVSEVRTKGAEITVVHDVIRLAYQYEINRRKKEIAKKRQKRFELIQSYLAGRPFPSPQQKAERNLVSTRLTNLTIDALKVEGDLAKTYENLSLYVPLEPESEIEVPWLKGVGTLDKTEWARTAPKKNADLLAQQLRIDSSRKEKSLAKREVLPDLGISGFYRTESAGGAERAVGGGLELTVPVWNWNRSGIKSAEKRLEADERLLRFNELDLRSQLGESFAAYEVAREAVRRYSALSGLKKQMREADEEFRKGRLALIPFLELDSAIYETEFRALEAQFDLADKFLTLMSLAGERDVLSRLEVE
jgi:outer membrane protein TolC